VVARGPRSQFIRYAAIGTLGFGVSTAVLYALRALGLDPYSAYAVAFVAAVTATWWLNRNYNFADRSGSTLAQWARFFTTSSIAGAVNLATYAVLVFAIGIVHAHPVLGAGAGTLAGLAINFVAVRRYVFVGAAAPPATSG
jgi:putative flippase GtrA